ncbi:WYL domain-containing protein [Nocardia sp. CA-120079]|uniref:WYL domain-containing protein n=1 Tax=Nocardia sp. CA-120079 TaxID=3239974 RepID=UPI003D9A00D9
MNPAQRQDLVATALTVRAEETDSDGWLRLELTFQDPKHAEWALWQVATNAEALAPQWLRDSLHNRAAAIAASYAVSPCRTSIYEVVVAERLTGKAAGTIAFLASDDAGFITGAAIPLDGGITEAFTVPERVPAKAEALYVETELDQIAQ